MKITLRLATGTYEYLEAEFSTIEEYQLNHETVRLEAKNAKSLAEMTASKNEHPFPTEHSYTPEPPSFQPEGKCKTCYADMVPGKNGKPYCKPCYVKWANANKKQ